MVTQQPLQIGAGEGRLITAGQDQGSVFCATRYGPFELANGEQFSVFFDLDFPAFGSIKLTVERSVDGGASWASEDDVNRPAVVQRGGLDVWRTGDVLYILYAPTLADLTIQTFDMNARAFGAASATLATGNLDFLPNVRIARDAGGDFWAFFQEPDSNFTFSPIKYAHLVGGLAGAWGAAVTIQTGFATVYTWRAVAIDAADLMHLVYQKGSASTATPRLLTYQSLTTGGVLSAPAVIATASNNDWPAGYMSVWQSADKLVLPCVNGGKGGVFVGSGLASIVWDPWLRLNNSISGQDIVSLSTISLDGSTASVFWTVLNPGVVEAWYCSLNSGAGWGSETLFYDAVTNPPLDGDPTFQNVHRGSASVLLSGLYGFLTDMEINLFDSACAAFSLVDGPPTPPPVVVTPVRGLASGGAGFSDRIGCKNNKPPNIWNECLWTLEGQFRRMIVSGYMRLLEGATRDGCSVRDVMPREGRQLLRVGALALPADDGADNTVLRFRVPTGWDGVLIVQSNLYTGPGFVDGSGDLTWRFKAGYRYLPDSGAIDIERAALTDPVPLEGAWWPILSRQVVEISVAVAVGAAARLNPGGLVIGAVLGYLYPRRPLSRRDLRGGLQ